MKQFVPLLVVAGDLRPVEAGEDQPGNSGGPQARELRGGAFGVGGQERQ
jgi:hypothetical protein